MFGCTPLHVLLGKHRLCSEPILMYPRLQEKNTSLLTPYDIPTLLPFSGTPGSPQPPTEKKRDDMGWVYVRTQTLTLFSPFVSLVLFNTFLIVMLNVAHFYHYFQNYYFQLPLSLITEVFSSLRLMSSY